MASPVGKYDGLRPPVFSLDEFVTSREDLRLLLLLLDLLPNMDESMLLLFPS